MISLFNGRDLSSFYRWLAKYGHEDPHRVFTVLPDLDGAPAIRISGEDMGGLITRESYANYKLVVELRWGTETWAPKKGKARDSGILLHCQGADGNVFKDFRGPWLRSIEFQITEGGTGDFYPVAGYDRGSILSIPTHIKVRVRAGERTWTPEGVPTEFTNGRIEWHLHDPQGKDVTGFRGPQDAEKPRGEWNRLEAICDGGRLTYFVNGLKVNEGTDCTLRSGKLLVQSEGAEVYYRRIELQPLPK